VDAGLEFVGDSLLCCVGLLFGSGFLGLGTSVARDEWRSATPTASAIIATLLVPVPLALFGMILIAQAVKGFVLRCGELRKFADIDRPQLVILRRPSRRILPTLFAVYVAAIGGFFLASDLLSPSWHALLPGAFLFWASNALWAIWRRPGNAVHTIVLDEEGFTDLGTQPTKILWRDVRQVLPRIQTVVLADGFAQSPNLTRLQRFRSWLHRSPRLSIARASLLQPDGLRAMKIVRAYWQRRLQLEDSNRTKHGLSSGIISEPPPANPAP
jgi:hypothetical protein